MANFIIYVVLSKMSIMGLYTLVEQLLPKQFSIYRLMTLLNMEEDDARECRNILKQFAQQGYIKRLSKNMYEKIVESEPAEQAEEA